MISIIIPAHNEQEHIGGTVRAAMDAAAHLDRSWELIVADDDSSDRTAAIATEAGARVVPVRHRHIAAVRNAGAAAARGDRLVFLDADTHLPPDTLRAAISALAGGAVGGGARVRFDIPVEGQVRLALGLWNTLARLYRWAAGCFVFARRDIFEAVGGFDERFYASEEIHLSNQLKRHGPFRLLDHHVVTSARKTEAQNLQAHWSLLLRTVLSRGRALQAREGLGHWYGPAADRVPAPRPS
ncbi:MAG: glycosyltransferase [Phycisphaerae bacterium]|nr:glycosyltransferase [Phycisphaerae bacterium]